MHPRSGSASTTLQGNRGYISGDWKVVSLQPPLQAINLDNWMLFNIAKRPYGSPGSGGQRT